MGKRSKARNEPRRRPRKKLEPKRRVAPKRKARSRPPAAAEETEIARLSRELNDARDQQTAMSEVLHAISRSKFELSAVLESVAEASARLCRADGAVIFQLDGGVYRFAAGYSLGPAYMEIERQSVIAPGPGTVVGRAAMTRKVVRIDDLLADPLYEKKEDARVEGNRSMIGVPLLHDGEPVVVIGLGRRRIDPFGEREIELATTFAAQAMIAIENARLLNELRGRTADLAEALEQQTATSDVLQVISSSPGDLEPVFAALLDKAVRLCDAKFGSINRWDGETLQVAATHQLPPAFAEFRGRSPFRATPNNPIGRMLISKAIVQVRDLAAEQGYLDRDPTVVAAVEIGGIRTLLAVPMLKESELIGALIVYSQEIHPFTDKQIELVQNFAAQAVIAIENARLLSELRQRTSDLTESLDQQTATSEVLQVISGSPGELDPVFATMLASATRICEAQLGNLFLREGDTFRAVAWHGAHAYTEDLRRQPLIIKTDRPDIPLARLAATKRRVHVPDLREDVAYKTGFAPLVALVDRGGARTLLIVPMLKEHTLLGAIAIYRQEVRPFSDKQIALVENFAAQAVIAIENARLLNELRQRTVDLAEALEQQTATSEVLQVISSSPGDLQPVFAAMLENAARICDASFGNIHRWDGEGLHLIATHNTPSAFADVRKGSPYRPSPGTHVDRMIATKTVVHVADLAAEQAYVEERNPAYVEVVELGGVRTFLAVPMVTDNDLVGAFTLYRKEVRPFTDRQIELVQNFAAQAVIAIENARLLSELREKTDEVVKLNQQLERRVADQVGEIERMGRLRRFLPPQVADLIVASGAEKQLESHRREITALFCDLRGFTGFAESADPEDVMALLRDYHAALGDIIIKYSGTLERYAGDGVMVVFNDPVPVENPALQAVLMALEMRDAIGAFTEKWRRMGHDIGFGIGIAHGFATLGTIGFEGRFDYAAIGTVSNVASRLCDEAKPGQILISPRVLMEVDDAITVEPAGEFALKGIRRPLAAYNVLAARSAPEPGAGTGG